MDKINTSPRKMNRREFLKVSGAALGGALILPIDIHRQVQLDLAEAQSIYPFNTGLSSISQSATGARDDSLFLQGRIIDPYIQVYKEPTFDSEALSFVWKDSVVPILSVYYNAETKSHNRVWYQISENNFVHSASIQPVNTFLNEPSSDIPPEGRLAEVTVPFTDAYWAIGKDQPLAYRMYYQTTHWVVRLDYDTSGSPWYTILEDKWELAYYMPAQHLRLIPESELKPISPDIPNALKRIEVHLASQFLVAYELDTPVFMSRVATGGKFRDGDFTTKTGHYLTFHKRPSRHMAAGNLAAGGYDLPGVPWISYFTESGVSIHGTYWHNSYGRPRSHGCINMSPAAAKWIYLWTTPTVPFETKMVYKNYGTSLEILEE